MTLHNATFFGTIFEYSNFFMFHIKSVEHILCGQSAVYWDENIYRDTTRTNCKCKANQTCLVRQVYVTSSSVFLINQ